MTDEEINAHVVDLAERAITASQAVPGLAVVILIDAALCLMLRHMSTSTAVKLAPTYGAYIVEQIAGALGTRETIQ